MGASSPNLGGDSNFLDYFKDAGSETKSVGEDHDLFESCVILNSKS